MNTLKLALLTLAAGLIAVGQQNTSLADKLEATIRPAKGTLGSDVQAIKSVNEEMDKYRAAVQSLMETIKKGPQPPAAKDMALLARTASAFMSKGSLYNGLMSTFNNHGIVLFKKIEDFLTEANVKRGSPEAAQINKKVEETTNWWDELESSTPQRKAEDDLRFFQEVALFLTPPKAER